MNHKNLFILLLILLPAVSSTQQKNEFEITDFTPGSLSGEMSFYFPWLFGLEPESLQESIYDVVGTTLPRIKTGGVSIDILPPLSVDVISALNLQSELDKSLQDSTKDQVATGVTVSAPKMSFRVGQLNDVAGVNVNIPVKNFVIGFMHQKLLNFKFSGSLTGMEIAQSQSFELFAGQTESISMRFSPNISIETLLEFEKNSFRFGGLFDKKFSLEAVIDRYGGMFKMNNYVSMTGVGRVGSKYMEFGTQETNKLDQKFVGNFNSSAYGYKIGGGVYFFGGKIYLNALYNSAPKLKFSGNLSMTGYQLNPNISSFTVILDDAISRAGDINDVIDIIITTITTTNKKQENILDTLEFKFPSSVKLDFVWQGRGAKFRFGFANYLSPFNVNSTEPTTIKLKNAIDFDFITRIFQMKLGVITSDKTIIPLFSIGFGIPLGRNWQIDELIVALPLQVLKTTLTYRF